MKTLISFFLIYGAVLARAEEVELNWPGETWEIQKTEERLNFHAPLWHLQLPITTCTRPSIEKFWREVKTRAAKPAITGRTRIQHLRLSVNGETRNIFYHPEIRYLSKLDREFLGLTGQLAKTCARDVEVALKVRSAKMDGRKPAQSSSPTQMCVESICKDPTMAYETLVTASAMADGGEYERNNIGPIWDAWLKLDLEHGVDSFKQILTADLRGVEIKNRFLVAYNRLSSGLIGSLEIDDFDLINGVYVMKRERLFKRFPSHADDERALLGRLLSRLITVFTQSETLDTLSVENLSLYYPDPDDLRRRLTTILETHEANIKRIKNSPITKEFYALRRKQFELDSFPELMRGEAVTSADLDDDDSTFKLTALIAAWANEEIVKADVGDATLKPEQIGFEAKYKELAKTRLGEVQALLANPQKALDESKCASYYIQSLSYSPTADQIAKAKSDEAGVRSRFRQFIDLNFKPEEAARLHAVSQTWKADYPLPRMEWRARYEARLKTAYERFKNSKEPDLDNPEIIAAFLPATLDKPYELDVADYCKTNMLSGFSDATVTVNKKFSVGPVTVQMGEKGHGVIFHELGHLLSSVLRVSHETRTKKLLQCLTSQHVDDGESRQEEDFADWVSFQIEKKSNLGCFFTLYSDPAGYADEVLKASEGDSHSSHLFRTLHGEYIATGRTPPVCSQLARTQKFKMQFKRCKL